VLAVVVADDLEWAVCWLLVPESALFLGAANPRAAGRLNTKEAPPFGQRMATLRQRKGFTQTQLAARMNTTQKVTG
jgi:hypothetical protein